MTSSKKNIPLRMSEPLSHLEWTTCWMAVRYAMGRQTIAAAMLPGEIIKEYYHRFSNIQKEMLIKELKRYVEENKHFGNLKIDNIHWLKFLSCLDISAHFNVLLKDDTTLLCFETLGVIYPLSEYFERPYNTFYIPEEMVVGTRRRIRE